MSEQPIHLPIWVRLLLIPFAWTLAKMPHVCRNGLSSALGWFLFHAFHKRRRILLSNLHHAYPDWPESKRRRVGRRSCSGVIEMGLLALCGPFLSLSWIRRHFVPTPRMEEYLSRQITNPRPALYLVPHQALFEGMLWLCRSIDTPEVGILYRPPDQPGFARYLEWSRAKTGVVMLSKRAGLAHALGFLRRKGQLAILFDQNAGPPGAGVLFLDQLCSATDLPGTFAEKFDPEIQILYHRRISGWKVEMDLIPLDTRNTAPEVTRNSNDWLSHTLWSTSDEVQCADYMWLHNRWKFQWDIRQCLSYSFKKDYLPESPPRSRRFWIRIPDKLESIRDLVAFLEVLRRSRPDAAITILGHQVVIQEALPRLQPVSERQIAIPQPANRRFFSDFKTEYPDFFINLSEDAETDREGVWMNIPARLGWTYPGHRRPLLTATHVIDNPEKWKALSPLERWLTFGRHFGLKTPEDPHSS